MNHRRPSNCNRRGRLGIRWIALIAFLISGIPRADAGYQVAEAQANGAFPTLFPCSRIVGAIATGGETDRYAFDAPSLFLPSGDAVLTFRLSYVHDSSFFSPQSHLAARVHVFYGDFGGCIHTEEVSDLRAPFFVNDGANTLSTSLPESLLWASLPSEVSPPVWFEVQVYAPGGGTNASYQLEGSIAVPPDSLMNDGVANATELEPEDPDSLTWCSGLLTIHESADEDWFAFTPGMAGNYQVRVEESGLGLDALGDEVSLAIEVRRENGTILAMAQRLDAKLSTAIFTASEGERLFLRVTSGGQGVLNGYRFVIGLRDFNESVPGAARPSSDPPFEIVATEYPSGAEIHNFVLAAGGFAPFFSRLADVDRVVLQDLPPGKYLFTVESNGPKAPDLYAGSPQSQTGDSEMRRVGRRTYNAFVQDAPGPVDVTLSVAGDCDQAGKFLLRFRPYSDFDLWREASGLPPTSFEEDLNGDGVPIGVVWALGLDPVGNRSGLIQPSVQGGLVRFTIPLPPGGTRGLLFIQQSSDLKTWVDVPNAAVNTGSALVPQGTVGTLVVTLPVAGASTYLRLQI